MQQQKTVLVVEDYVDARAVMKFVVSGYGYEVIEAKDGFEAVEKARAHRPDLILMDLAMPEMDGLTATNIISELDGLSNVPIIALTAFGNSYFHKALQAGCAEMVEKPLDYEKLEPLLKRYLA
jgi:two-component system cell cycle response regulator DivK